MKILYIVPWSIPFEESNLQDIVNTQFGYYTLKNKSADITWFTHKSNSSLKFEIMAKQLYVASQRVL